MTTSTTSTSTSTSSSTTTSTVAECANGECDGGPEVPPVPPVKPPVPPETHTDYFDLKMRETHQVQHYADVDLLWVVDNSRSMAPIQEKLVKGFKSFANKYFNEDRDLRIATITTDTYLAGHVDPDRLDFVKYGPKRGFCLGRLLPGVHDGPIPNVAKLANDCSLLHRHEPMNRSGKPILSTKNADGTITDIDDLIRNFRKNAVVGDRGGSSERGLQSVNRLLDLNEERPACAGGAGPGKDPSCFFGKNRLRGIVFISDEQSHDYLNFPWFSDGAVDNTEASLMKMSDSQMLQSTRKAADMMKERLNRYFRRLDGGSDPRYFVVSIANNTCSGETCGVMSDGLRYKDERWGASYSSMVDTVSSDPSNSAGAYSLKADIHQPDYSHILDKLGMIMENEVRKVDVLSFTLSDVPSSIDGLLVFVMQSDGVTPIMQVSSEFLRLSGNVLEIETAGLPNDLPDGAKLKVIYFSK